MLLQEERLLAASPEHERVAALEPHDGVLPQGCGKNARVDVILARAWLARLFADVAQLGMRRRQLEQLRAHQRVVEDDVGVGEHARGLDGEQLRIAGAGSDQVHHAALCHLCLLQQRFARFHTSSISHRAAPLGVMAPAALLDTLAARTLLASGVTSRRLGP
ncbi:MAG: hypothetical protein A2138_05990 [Deltaproteobacteria bacterium RBG_16_71_12]|nr:MAG: hypothetical protein A2138_05990 [Deltaproteobacteria bacterium RBG_16_71_12]